LEIAGQLQAVGKIKKIKTLSGKAVIHIMLPRQGISLVKMEW
jgi:hypothetical protein